MIQVYYTICEQELKNVSNSLCFTPCKSIGGQQKSRPLGPVGGGGGEGTRRTPALYGLEQA